MTSLDSEVEEKYESGVNRLLQEHNRIKLRELVNEIESNPNYIVIPERHSYSWHSLKKSRLIESLIINFPVTPIVLIESDYGNYQLIAGKEKLNAILEFFSDSLTLTDLEVETELNGRTYSTLPDKVRKQLDNRNLSTITISLMNDSNPNKVERLLEIARERLEGFNS